MATTFKAETNTEKHSYVISVHLDKVKKHHVYFLSVCKLITLLHYFTLSIQALNVNDVILS